jgi:competence protein ComEA
VLFPPEEAQEGLLDLALVDRAVEDEAGEDSAGEDSAGEDSAGEDSAGEDSAVDGEAVEDSSGVRRRSDRPRLSVSLRLGTVVAVLLAASCASWWGIAQASGHEGTPVDAADPAAANASAPSPPSAPSQPGAPAAGGPTVHVVGAVVSPGVYRLAPGSRVHEAIAAAGGAMPVADVDRLNLAAPVDDGTRLKVPARGEPVEPQGPPGGAPPPSSGPGLTPGPGSGNGPRKVNINTASVEDLGALPRVGPVLAQRIVEYRSAHGRFSSPEDLDAVSGIGPKMLESLLPLVTVG